LSIELKERLTDAWERAFPEPLSLGARVAGGFFVAYAVLSAASAWLLVPEAAKGLRLALFAAAAMDALLGLTLLAGRERAHVLAAVRLSLGTLAVFFMARAEPALIGAQVLLACGFLLLLLGEPDRKRGAAGALVLALLLVPMATHVAAPYTQSTPLAELMLELRGGLEPGQVTAARGPGQPSYKLTFPGTGWRQARHEVLQRWPSGVDRAWILPWADATVFVESLSVPAAAAMDLDAFVERLQTEGVKAGDVQVELVDSVALDGPFDAARRLHLREKGSRKRMESLTTLWVRGDHLFQITALAPSHRFPALRAQLAGILDSFSFQPRRTALPQETLDHVRQGTVMVVTPQGSGSGFIFHSGKGNSYILTNDHVVRDRQGYTFGVVDVVVQDAEGRRSLRQMAVVDREQADPRLDLAVLRLQHLETDTLPVLELRHSESMRAGARGRGGLPLRGGTRRGRRVPRGHGERRLVLPPSAGAEGEGPARGGRGHQPGQQRWAGGGHRGPGGGRRGGAPAGLGDELHHLHGGGGEVPRAPVPPPGRPLRGSPSGRVFFRGRRGGRGAPVQGPGDACPRGDGAGALRHALHRGRGGGQERRRACKNSEKRGCALLPEFPVE
jgi:S1-C subfamily serine protease